MKKSIILFFYFLLSLCYSQNRLNDEAIVSQHKRMVYDRWGDWRPYGKYFLGIQTNFAYATVWGWLAPKRNRRYKAGADIRPLKIGGEEMKRTILAKEQEKLAEKIKIRQDSIYKRKLQDFAYWTPLTVDADPLWLLYYKRMLKPLKEFPDKLSDWNGFDEEGYKKLYSLGTITRLQENLDLLKNQYEISRTVSMPRGKRFILYHKTLIGWRKFLSNLDSEKKNASLMISYKQREKERKQPSEIYNHQTDMKIAERVFIKYRQLIHNN